MKSMTLLVAMALVSPALVSHASGADLKPPRDGWASWEVPAVEGAPFNCCWNNWDDRKDARKPCKLDAHQSYGTRDDDGTTDAVTVYARLKDGKVEKLKAVASSCPVEASTLSHRAPSGSIFFRDETASAIGTWVNRWFQNPTTMSVRPLIPACAALCPSSRQNAESCGVAGTLLMA